ncbi:IPP transferase-domain-containing protein [Podospora fimiseda]|uniref:tRNA dimethylallyltransferase n=1 Tax=Podospora fimiseda TaxID=252190 RepID=A0AAN7BVN8_9PEZI|nr:IPP transferase-domain-containing protein [Podospora fimiseda]
MGPNGWGPTRDPWPVQSAAVSLCGQLQTCTGAAGAWSLPTFPNAKGTFTLFPTPLAPKACCRCDSVRRHAKQAKPSIRFWEPNQREIFCVMLFGFLSKFAQNLLGRSAQLPNHFIIKRMKPLIIIYGSTGTGKSDLAVELATRFNGEVINADAMQMYRGLPVITNKISVEEQKGIPHHLLGNVELGEEPWFVTKFKKEATSIIYDIRTRGKTPIVVGGSSYYLDSLLFDDKLVENLEQATTENWKSTREELAEKYPILTGPPDALLAKLREVDPVMADRWHPNDDRKIRTSLEIYFGTGRRASDIYAEQRTRKESKWASSSATARDPNLGEVLLFWLYADRDLLNERLEKRVDKMVKRGLISEIAEAYDYLQKRLSSGETVDISKGIWQSIGFRQFEPYLRTLKESPDNPSLAQLKEVGVDDTKTATRQYAKYQVRWLKTKTILALQEEKLLDRFYLLDSSNIQKWHEEVLAKGVELARRFLAQEELPKPINVSETAQKVLTEALERSNRKDTPCLKTCEICKKTVLTEELWHAHITSRKHAKVVRALKKRALVPERFHGPRALVKVDDNVEETTTATAAATAVDKRIVAEDKSPSIENEEHLS